jgi:hypothetical protein
MKKMIAMSKYDLNLRNRVMQEAAKVAATVPATDGAATGGAAFEETGEDYDVKVTVDFVKARELDANEEALKIEGAGIYGALMEGYAKVFQDHKEALDGFARKAEDADKQRAQYLLDTIADGVKINGETVRDMLGAENVPTIHHLKKANYNVRRMLQTAIDEAHPEQKPDGVVMDFTISWDVQ